MKNRPHYVFDYRWTLDASADDAFLILRDVPNYPAWYPLVKEVRDLGNGKYWYRCRSVLPYDLVFETLPTIQDESKGILEASMIGDLEGTTKWTILSLGTHKCEILFHEDVVTNKKLLNILAPVARPAFELNHWISMVLGQRSIRKYAAGYSTGRAAFAER